VGDDDVEPSLGKILNDQLCGFTIILDALDLFLASAIRAAPNAVSNPGTGILRSGPR
jgi:hypothetical protein